MIRKLDADLPFRIRVTAEGSAAVAMDELNPFTVVCGRWRRV